MTNNELKLASLLLDKASKEFGRHGCNDVDKNFYSGWSIEERKKFVKEYHDYNGDPEEYDENFLHIPDFALMGYLSHKLGNITELRKHKLKQINMKDNISNLMDCLNEWLRIYIFVEQLEIDENIFSEYKIEEFLNDLDDSLETSGVMIYQLSTKSGINIAKIKENWSDGGKDDTDFIEVENEALLKIIKENYLTIVFELIKEKVLN